MFNPLGTVVNPRYLASKETKRPTVVLVTCRLQVRSDADARFIALLRHSHVMPFVPIKGHTTEGHSDSALFAVLQPLDGIAQATLDHFSRAHECRAHFKGWDGVPEGGTASTSGNMV
jgi:hypothetical protein